MDGSPESPAVARLGRAHADRLTTTITAALAASDAAGARELIREALDGGASAGPLYVQAVRPALAELLSAHDRLRARVGENTAAALVTDLSGSIPVGEASGTGRTAIVWSRSAGIAGVDAGVATDFLRADGWRVDRLDVEGSPRSIAVDARHDGVELAVAVAAGPEDVLKLSATLNGLRRLADPPVILLCDFSALSRTLPLDLTTTVDAIVHDPQELASNAIERSAAPGHRRWGVRLERSPDTLTLTPTGRFDAASSDRLVDIALSRLGSFRRLALDLRDVAEVETGGLVHLAGWPGLLGPGEVEVLVIAGARARERIHAQGVPAGLQLVADLSR